MAMMFIVKLFVLDTLPSWIQRMIQIDPQQRERQNLLLPNQPVAKTQYSDRLANILKDLHPFLVVVAGSAATSSSVIEFDDLYQAGALAIVDAVNSHDIAKGSGLYSYVKSCARRAIYKEAAQFYGPFYLPKGVLSLVFKVQRLDGVGELDEEIVNKLSGHNRTIDTQYIECLRKVYRARQEDMVNVE
jgi:hypothetical protein